MQTFTLPVQSELSLHICVLARVQWSPSSSIALPTSSRSSKKQVGPVPMPVQQGNGFPAPRQSMAWIAGVYGSVLTKQLPVSASPPSVAM